jgi:hypothetical protein
VDLTGPEPQCTWSVPLSVLDEAFLLDADADGKISPDEWQKAEEIIKHELTTGLILSVSEKPLTLKVQEIKTAISSGVPTVTVKCSFHLESPAAPLSITSNLLAAEDPLHRVLLHLTKDSHTAAPSCKAPAAPFPFE